MSAPEGPLNGDPPDGPPGEALDRREFVIRTGTVGATVYFAASPAALAKLAALPPPGATATPGGKPKLTFTSAVRRPDDFLSLRFEFWNLALDSSDPASPVVKRDKANKASYLVVHFTPQAIAEETFLEPAPEFADAANQALEDPGDVRARLSGGSRLSFYVPNGIAIPYTYAGLLAWAGFQHAIVPVAVTNLGRGVNLKLPKIREPDDWETALEVPWRLILSPNQSSGWAHADAPVEHGGRYELWHTRLGTRSAGEIDELGPSGRFIRAVWALDANIKDYVKNSVPDHSDAPFPMSLDARDRASIVRNTSDWFSSAGDPRPAAAERLMLSALGAWLDVRGVWDTVVPNNENITLEEWRHRGVLGRDTYVRIVEKGFLFPFGHPAVVIKVTERKIQSKNAFAPNAAYLRKRYFVVVRGPDRTLGNVAGMRADGRGFPFDHVRITTLVTPNLLAPADTPLKAGFSTTKAWIPHVAAGVPFRFHAIGTDKEGKKHELTTPLVFVDGNAAFFDVDAIVGHYNDLDEALRTVALQGQSVAIAKGSGTKPGDTNVEINELVLGGEKRDPAQNVAAGQPPYFPNMESALVRLAAAEQASGGDVKPRIAYFAPYVSAGFAGDGEVFAELVTDAAVEFRTDKSGGVIQPSFGVTAISRKLGPTGGTPASVDSGSIDPAEFFGNAGKLLGGVLLKDILDVIDDFTGDAALKLESRRFDDRLETELRWKPALKSNAIFDTKGTATLDLNALIVTRVEGPGGSEVTIKGDLRNFAINLFGPDEPAAFVRLDFNRLSFLSQPGRSSEIDVAIKEVTFLGVLKFVQQLQELMSLGDEGSGPSIELTPAGIEAKFAIPIPSIQVGVFGLSNMKFGAGLIIPFSGDPVIVSFNFSEREDTFCIQVAFFAGGGFFGIEIGAGAVRKVEAALEFGARLALDVGVASGSVEAMAGIYFSYEDVEGVTTTVLTGYVRLRGELEVMAIVSLTIEFNLSLTYKVVDGNDKAIGQATVTVTVEVFIFSGEVSMTAERRFGKGSGDPTLAQQMSASDWETYASKFAAVPA